ncbi:MAG: protocatechuate 3,4-dioxygenase [Zavarzinella sp.]
MNSFRVLQDRRQLIRSAAVLGAAWFVPGAFAEELLRTAALTEGPFYPDKLPLDTDNDLLNINDGSTPALGTVTHLTGKVMTQAGTPLRNAVVEIWQCDNNGAYLHSGSDNGMKRDKNFQGYGRFLTNSKGEYYFRTIKPVPYPGRTPHIHFIVKQGTKRLLTTQMLIKGDPGNERDGLFRQIRDAKLRETLLVDFKPIKESRIGELAANFDIVVGVTPDEKKLPPKRG